MKSVKIKFSELSSKSNGSFADAAQVILESFEEHTVEFPSPTITVAILDGKISEFINLDNICKSDNASTATRNQRDICREALYEMLLLNGLYVLGIANSKETYEQKKAIVEMANYPLASDTHNPVEKLPIEGLKVSATATPGVNTIAVRWKKGKAAACLLQGTTGDPSSSTAEWINLEYSIKSKTELTLAPGKWSIRAIGVYATGHSLASPAITVVIS